MSSLASRMPWSGPGGADSSQVTTVIVVESLLASAGSSELPLLECVVPDDLEPEDVDLEALGGCLVGDGHGHDPDCLGCSCRSHLAVIA